MKEKIVYYSVKVIAIIIFLYSCYAVFGLSYSYVHTIAGKLQSMLGPENADIFSGLQFVTALFVIDGMLALFGSIGLFFFKKFGYYLTISSIILFCLISFMPSSGALMFWPIFSIAILIFIYLLFIRKNITAAYEQNPYVGDKMIKIMSIVIVVMLMAFTVFLMMQASSLKQQGKIPTIQAEKTENGEQIKVISDELGNKVTAPVSVPISSLTSKASEVAGFKIFCPTFIPKEFKMDFFSIIIGGSSKTAFCDLGDTNPTESSPVITISEKPILTAGVNPFQSTIDALTSKQDVDINGIKGVSGISIINNVSFNRLIFIAAGKTAITVQSKDFNLDLLLKVARSLQ